MAFYHPKPSLVIYNSYVPVSPNERKFKCILRLFDKTSLFNFWVRCLSWYTEKEKLHSDDKNSSFIIVMGKISFILVLLLNRYIFKPSQQMTLIWVRRVLLRKNRDWKMIEVNCKELVQVFDFLQAPKFQPGRCVEMLHHFSCILSCVSIYGTLFCRITCRTILYRRLQFVLLVIISYRSFKESSSGSIWCQWFLMAHPPFLNIYIFIYSRSWLGWVQANLSNRYLLLWGQVFNGSNDGRLLCQRSIVSRTKSLPAGAVLVH